MNYCRGFSLVLVSLVIAMASLSLQQVWPPVTMSYAEPTRYPCMEDWGRVCEVDDDCCSGVCMTFFCKVVGIEATTTPGRRKRPRITINISK